MKSLRRMVWLFLGVYILSACGNPYTPTEAVTSSPINEWTPQIDNTATINATATTTPIPSVNATSTSEMSPFPICMEASNVELEDLMLAIVAKWDGDNEIYFIKADGSNLTQVTFNTSGDVVPSWSPDGRWLAYITDRYTEPRLFISEIDGQEGKILAPEVEAFAPALFWSPVGDKIAFRNLDAMYVVDTKNGETQNLTTGTNLLPLDLSFSADGSMLAFSADVLTDTARNRLFIINVDGTGLKEIHFPEGDVYRPTWHPSRDLILFEGIVPSEGVVLHVANINGTIEKLPIVPKYGAPKPTWSPDGSMIGYIVHLSGFDSAGERLQLNSLHIATAAGDVDLVLVKPPEEPDVGLSIYEIVWAPDSRHIAYSTPGEVGVDLYVLDICDGTSSLIIEAIDAFSTPSWRPLP
jgi:Tol biopolymer transport system component